jgi:hypothetical protein
MPNGGRSRRSGDGQLHGASWCGSGRYQVLHAPEPWRSSRPCSLADHGASGPNACHVAIERVGRQVAPVADCAGVWNFGVVDYLLRAAGSLWPMSVRLPGRITLSYPFSYLATCIGSRTWMHHADCVVAVASMTVRPASTSPCEAFQAPVQDFKKPLGTVTKGTFRLRKGSRALPRSETRSDTTTENGNRTGESTAPGRHVWKASRRWPGPSSMV